MENITIENKFIIKMVVPFLNKNGKFSLCSVNNGEDFFEISPYKNTSDSKNHYDFIDFFYEGIAIANKLGKQHFIKTNGENLKIGDEYYHLQRFDNGVAAVKSIYSERWNFINKDGVKISNNKYDEYFQKCKGFINVSRTPPPYIDYFDGLIDINGNEIVPLKKSNIFQIYENFIIVNDLFHYRVIDFKGNLLRKISYNDFGDINYFYRGRAFVFSERLKKYLIVDDNFNIVRTFDFDFSLSRDYYTILIGGERITTRYTVGLCPINVNGSWGLIDLDGKLIIKPKYDYFEPFMDEFALSEGKIGCAVVGIKLDDKLKLTIINEIFEEVTDFIYDEITIDENIAVVKIGNNYGAINKQGEIILPIEYLEVMRCSNGMIGFSKPVLLDSCEETVRYGFANISGKMICPMIYENVYLFNNQLSVVKKNGLYGVINTNGKEIISCIYDEIESHDNTIFRVAKNNETYYVLKNGMEMKNT